MTNKESMSGLFWRFA